MAAEICSAAWGLMKAYAVSYEITSVLRTMAPDRQLEACREMIGRRDFSLPHAIALLAETPPSGLEESFRRRCQIAFGELDPKQRDDMESGFPKVEARYGTARLELIAAEAYVRCVLTNRKLSGLLRNRHPDLWIRLSQSIDQALPRAKRHATHPMEADFAQAQSRRRAARKAQTSTN